MRFDRISIFILAFTITACSNLERRRSPTPETPEPTFETSGEPTKPLAAPPLALNVPKKVGIILGPGGAKALAHAGVLKELQKNRIPIHSVIGLEWGALVGGLFAQRGQTHEMEWKLYKLERQKLPSKEFLSSKLKAEPMSSMREFLRESFSRQDSSKTQVVFSCPTQTVEASEFRWTEGDLAEGVENCMAFPPLYIAEGGTWAGAGAAIAAVDRLRASGVDFIIMVNVLNAGPLADPRQLPDSGASAILWQEVRRNMREAASRVNQWVEVETGSVFISDFSKRKELVTAGEKAGQLATRTLTTKYGF